MSHGTVVNNLYALESAKVPMSSGRVTDGLHAVEASLVRIVAALESRFPGKLS